MRGDESGVLIGDRFGPWSLPLCDSASLLESSVDVLATPSALKGSGRCSRIGRLLMSTRTAPGALQVPSSSCRTRCPGFPHPAGSAEVFVVFLQAPSSTCKTTGHGLPHAVGSPGELVVFFVAGGCRDVMSRFFGSWSGVLAPNEGPRGARKLLIAAKNWRNRATAILALDVRVPLLGLEILWDTEPLQVFGQREVPVARSCQVRGSRRVEGC